jgi:hypothetical protein
MLGFTDRLWMASLKRVRALFDSGEVGVILIGMMGLEKRLVRYPQFYSHFSIHAMSFGSWMPPRFVQLLDRR